VVFSIDVFSEGVDVPNVEMVMLLRPTTSEILWLQQIGRGLRQTPGKEFLTVVDLVGNHRSSDERYRWIKKHVPDQRKGPGGPGGPRGPAKWDDRCGIIFDTKLIEELSRFDYAAKREQALELMRGGMRCFAVSRKLDISATTCTTWAKQAGIPLGLDLSKQNTELKSLHSQGLTNEQIAKALNHAGWRTPLSNGLWGAASVRRALYAIGLQSHCHRSLRKERTEQAKSLFKAGKTPKQIASAMGASVTAVCSWLGSLHVKRPERYAKKRPRVLALLRAGKNYNEVGRLVGVAGHTAREWGLEAGLTRIDPVASLREQALKLNKAGVLGSEIARRLNVSATTICRWLVQAGIRKEDQFKELRPRAVALVKQGKNFKEVSILLGVSDNSIAKWCLEAGLPRPRGPYQTR
jgi:transposase